MATQASMVIRSYEAKRNAALSAIAVSIAKSRNDVLFLRLKRARRIWKDTKAQILQKYMSAALQQWAANQSKPR